MLKNIKRGGALLFSILMLTGCMGGETANDAAEDISTGAISDEDAENQTVTISLAEMHVAEHPITKSLVYFADEVERRTEGRVNIDVCPAALLGNESSIVAKVRNGSVDMARVSSITMSEYSPNLTPLALPYIFESREHMWEVVNSSLGDELLSGVEGCQGIAWIENGARCFYADVPIYSPNDMKGKKFRVPTSQTMYAMLRCYGATPVTVDFSQVYSNIEDGTICGAENDIISYDYFANSVVANYFVRNNHSYAPAMIIASDDLKDKVGEEDYDILLECAKNTEAKSREIWDEAETEVLENLEQRGVQVIEPNAQHMAQFRAAGQEIFNNYPQYADIIEEIQEMKG